MPFSVISLVVRNSHDFHDIVFFLQVFNFTDFIVHKSIDCPNVYGLSLLITELLDLLNKFTPSA